METIVTHFSNLVPSRMWKSPLILCKWGLRCKGKTLGAQRNQMTVLFICFPKAAVIIPVKKPASRILCFTSCRDYLQSSLVYFILLLQVVLIWSRSGVQCHRHAGKSIGCGLGHRTNPGVGWHFKHKLSGLYPQWCQSEERAWCYRGWNKLTTTLRQEAARVGPTDFH